MKKEQKKTQKKKGAGIFLALTISLFLVLFLSCGAQRERSQKETSENPLQPLKANDSK